MQRLRRAGFSTERAGDGILALRGRRGRAGVD
jgi:hypothetical protein